MHLKGVPEIIGKRLHLTFIRLSEIGEYYVLKIFDEVTGKLN